MEQWSNIRNKLRQPLSTQTMRELLDCNTWCSSQCERRRTYTRDVSKFNLEQYCGTWDRKPKKLSTSRGNIPYKIIVSYPTT